MSKGLPRSMSRGSALRQAVKKISLKIDHQVSVTAAGAAVGFGTVIVGGLPQSYLKIMSVATQIQFRGPTTANLDDNWDGDFSFGSAPTADVTLAGAEVDLISSTAIGAATAELSPVVTVADGVDLVIDNTDGSLEINLNLLVDAANIVDGSTVIIRARGVIEVVLVTMLDD